MASNPFRGERKYSIPALALKGLTTVFLLALIAWWGWSGYRYFIAERHMAVVKTFMQADPVVAFAASVKAYQTFPYPVEIRRQVGGAFLAAMGSGRARMHPTAAEIVWLISRSVSPWDVSGLVARAGWLLNHGGKVGAIADKLMKVAPWSAETWTIEAYRRIRSGEKRLAEAALKKAVETGRLDPPIRRTLERAIRSMTK